MKREINNDIIHENLLKGKGVLAFDEKANYREWKQKIKDKEAEYDGKINNKPSSQSGF